MPETIVPTFALAKEIENSFYGATSPDAALVCVCSTRKPVGKIRLDTSGRRRAFEETAGSFTIRIIEIGSWKELAWTSIGGDPSGFSFFATGHRLFGTFEIAPGQEMIAIDTDTNHSYRSHIPQLVYYRAFQANMLVGVRGGRQLVRVAWPGMNELVKVDTAGHAGTFHFPADRLKFVHLVDQDLVCRLSADFRVLWHRPVDLDIDLLSRLPWNPPQYGPPLAVAASAMSADGSTVVLAPRRAAFNGKPGRAYIEFLGGRDGKPVSRWDTDFKDEIVLSADGHLAATGETIWNNGCLEPTIRVYDVPSGRQVACLVHDRVPQKNRVNAYLNGGMEFTPDGSYLITSANNKVKFWALSAKEA